MPEITHPELPGVHIYLVMMTPIVAREILQTNTKGQRTISAATVERYASDMTTDDWIFNGAPILISSNNELIDGQHRLTAIVESNTPQMLLVVAGVDASAMATIDAGRKRSYADILKMRKFANHAIVAALTARVWQWYNGNYGVGNCARVPKPTHLGSAPSHAQRDHWMAKIEKAHEITFAHAAKFAIGAYNKRRGISASTYALAWVVLSGVDKDLRDSFFTELLDGSDDTRSGSPLAALHNRLNRIKPREDFGPVDQLNALFQTYNAWVLNRPLVTVTTPRPIRFNTLAVPVDYKEIDA